MSQEVWGGLSSRVRPGGESIQLASQRSEYEVGDLCLYFSVPDCGPPLSVSSAVCPTALGAPHGGSVVSRSGIRPPNLSLSLWGPTSRVLSVSVCQCSVGWSLTSQTSPGLPRKILRGSHQLLWILIRTFWRSSQSPMEWKVWFPQELLMTDCLVGLSLEHMLLHFHSGRTAASSFWPKKYCAFLWYILLTQWHEIWPVCLFCEDVRGF